MNAAEFNEIGRLTDWLHSKIFHRCKVLIDGFPGSGKTNLASALGSQLGLSVVHLDDLIEGRQIGTDGNRYIDLVDLDRLMCAQESAAQIIDGVTVLDFKEKLAWDVCVHVYVKKFTSGGLWDDEVELEPTPWVDSFAPPSDLRLAMRDYHHRWQPHQNCNAIFSWTET